MNLIKKYKHIFLLLSLISILSSCEKTQNENIVIGGASLSVNIEGLDFESEANTLASNETISKDKGSETHIQYVDEDFHIESQLHLVEESRSQNLKSNIKQNLSANSGPTELDDNIKYKLLVYNNANKNLVKEEDYTYKTESLADAIPLDTYTEYIFVVVSSGSTSTLPTITNKDNLNNATITTNDANILHWVSPVIKLNSGQNFLAAKLNPKYSEITVTLKMDPGMEGSITSITNPVLDPIVKNLSISLATGEVTEATGSSDKNSISFSIQGTNIRSITSTNTAVIHNETSAGILTFPSLTIAGEKRDNIKVSGLKLKPGRRYNLTINFKVCTQEVSIPTTIVWDYRQDGNSGIKIDGVHKPNGTILEKSYSMTGADYGFIFDILELDNAFNLVVNNTLIFGTDINKHEIQFERRVNNSPQNIEYADGSQYDKSDSYTNDLTDIWEIVGTKEKPSLRVIISPSGNVSLYGSKTSKGELFPLRLKDGKEFNTVTWNGGNTGINTVMATTRVQNHTKMIFLGSGIKKIECFPKSK